MALAKRLRRRWTRSGPTRWLPSANLIFMSCDQNPDQGIDTSMMALIDNDLADSMSMSYGESSSASPQSDYGFQDTLYAQAAAQGQSFFVSSGDSGSDVNDQNTHGTAISGINVNAMGSSPNVTVTGGTDFSDAYDAAGGGPAQSTYWGAELGKLRSALGYVPETAWNDSCASSIRTVFAGYIGAGYCADRSPLLCELGRWSAVRAASARTTRCRPISPVCSATRVRCGRSRTFQDLPPSGGWGTRLIFCDSYLGTAPCNSHSSFGEAGERRLSRRDGRRGRAAEQRSRKSAGTAESGAVCAGQAQFTAAATCRPATPTDRLQTRA